MISAWKKLISSKSDATDADSIQKNTPPGIQKLDKSLQRKFARGINYNLKVIIKGDARVGKSSLFSRLRGLAFDEEYNPTENLSVTSIDWNYKATDDVVKIDLWEAIDTHLRRSNRVDLKLDSKDSNGNNLPAQTDDEANTKTITNLNLSSGNSSISNPIPEAAQQSLTELSENFDVYKGADAVLLVMDMTKIWTYKYVQNEVQKIPKHIPILIIANFIDQGHHRTVSTEQVKAFIEGLDRTPCDAVVMYTETSMKNGFGLTMIKRFLNIPFLKLQEVSLLKQLELNRQEHLATREELQLMQDSVNQEYEKYLELQTILRRQQADASSPINNGLKELDEATREQIRNTKVSSETATQDQSKIKSIESTNSASDKMSSAQALAGKNFANNRTPSIVIGANCPLPANLSSQISSSNQQSAPQSSNDDAAAAKSDSDESDDDEEPKANPLVAGYQSDIDPDDQ